MGEGRCERVAGVFFRIQAGGLDALLQDVRYRVGPKPALGQPVALAAGAEDRARRDAGDREPIVERPVRPHVRALRDRGPVAAALLVGLRAPDVDDGGLWALAVPMV